MHILASAGRSLLNFNSEKISPVLKNHTRIIILVAHMYGYMKSLGKSIVETKILAQVFKAGIVMF